MRPEIIDIRGQLPRANPGNVDYRLTGEIDHVAWHYDAVVAPERYDAVRRYIAQARHHIAKNWGTVAEPAYGFGLMYTYKVARDGAIYQCQHETVVTWSVRDGNRRTLSICADLGPGQAPTVAQVESMRALTDWLCYERPDLANVRRGNVYGHGELTEWGNVTDCPGLLLEHVRQYRSEAPHPPARSLLFRETGHSVAGAFLEFWESLGERALGLFGFPISREMLQRLEDGNLYRVQYFERGRFELHGDRVVLGRLGAEVYERMRVEGAG